MKNSFIKKEDSSYKDPDGFVYYKNNNIYRQINSSYIKEFEKFKKSNFFKELKKTNSIVDFKEDNLLNSFDKNAKAVLKIKKIPFISYPYEWSFSQLKDAAILTLDIQKKALESDFSLKDASAYNIQFLNGKPILIDIFSFEKYQKGKPWVAYKQFCEHFLGPLLLLKYKDIRLGSLLRTNIDGIPLDLISSLLPKKTYFNFSTYVHIHLHAKNQRNYASSHNKINENKKINKIMLLGIIDSLKNLILKTSLGNEETEWGEYYSFTNYSDEAFENKKIIISKFIEKVNPKMVWDLGGNTGKFSRIASNKGIKTISFDIDPKAVEINYLNTKINKETNILPLLLDLTNISPPIGWDLNERKSLIDRKNADLVMALALIHHLSISKNIPFEKLAEFFQKLGNYLIIEFVPKEDSQVQKLLSTRKDIFKNYTMEEFEKTFSKFFSIEEKQTIGKNSKRTLYLMRKK
jgi:hypothetical protein